jgi:hypothetical protein
MNPSLDFARIITAFSAINKLKSPLQQAFVLSRTASFHGFPRAEFKRLFGIWQHEQAQLAAATQEEKAA